VTESTVRPPHILVVDDDLATRSLTLAILSRTKSPSISGAVLRSADSLGAARAVLAAESIDVVLLDVHLPDGIGLDLAAELRSRSSTAAIVALTASVLPVDQQAALDAGCDAFLAKPYAAAELLEIVDRFIARRSA
jgi:two-component system KDP operon response regulator KdpE